MERSEYLIGSNIIIDYFSGLLPDTGQRLINSIVDKIPSISVITKIEVLGFNMAEVHERLFIDFVNDSNVIELTDEIVNETIAIRKQHKIKLPDAIIAATAIAGQLILITRNVADFKKLKILGLIDPYIISPSV
jgi:predicted nucleic acid-binding protein